MFDQVLKSFETRIKRLIGPARIETRRAPRLAGPEARVYYWDGSSPEGHGLRDVSNTGAFVCTRDRWHPGTIVRFVLQGGNSAPADSACIPARVVRQCPDGVAVEFLFASEEEEESLRRLLAAIQVEPAVTDFAPQRPAPPDAGMSGQSLAEFALLLPLIFLVLINLVNFGGLFFAWITVANGARAGAQYMTMSSDSLGAPTAPTSAQVTALVTNDIASLLNKSSLAVRVCTNNNGTVSCAGSGSSTPPADPEPSTYMLGSVDVTYTYQPFISQWDLSGLGIHATLPATTVHQRAVMRMQQ